MNSDGQDDACHVCAVCVGMREGPSSSGMLQLLFVLQLLLKPKFSGVEKIKTIGSTYMAAAGLSATSGPENQVLQACVQGNTIGHSPVLSPSKGGRGLLWHSLETPGGDRNPFPTVVCVPSVKAAWSGLCNLCPAGPGAEACAHRCLSRV